MTHHEKAKLNTLCEIEGYDDPLDLLQAYIVDSICLAICMNGDCNYSCEMEPDQDQGWCEECHTPSMKSAMVLAGMV